MSFFITWGSAPLTPHISRINCTVFHLRLTESADVKPRGTRGPGPTICIGKHLPLSGPLQFKPMLCKGQLCLLWSFCVRCSLKCISIHCATHQIKQMVFYVRRKCYKNHSLNAQVCLARRAFLLLNAILPNNAVNMSSHQGPREKGLESEPEVIFPYRCGTH